MTTHAQKDVLEVVREFGTIAVKKPLMSEMCAVAIGDLAENVHRRGDDPGGVAREIVRECGMREGWVRCTPERLYLFLRLREVFSNEPWWAELANKWRHGDDDESTNAFTSGCLDSLVTIAEVGKAL